MNKIGWVVSLALLGGLMGACSKPGGDATEVSSTSTPRAVGSKTNELGIADNEILIGSCAVQTGPTAFLGTQSQLGAKAYFDYINKQGGVNGRQLKLKTYDDGYEADRADAAWALMEKDKVFCSGFFVGYALAVKYFAHAKESGIPMLGIYTGASGVHDPVKKEVFSAATSFDDESTANIQGLWADGFRKVAVFHQDDPFGKSVYRGAANAIEAKKGKIVAEGTYKRNATDVTEGYNTVKAANPQVVVFGAVYGPAAAFVRLAKKDKWKPIIVMNGTSGTEAFIREAGDAAEGSVITQRFPHYESDLPACNLYRDQLKKFSQMAEPNFVSYEGFVDAMIMVEALKRAGRDLTREKYEKALEAMGGVDIGFGPNEKLEFSPTNHKAFTHVFPTVIRDGKAVPLKSWKGLRH